MSANTSDETTSASADRTDRYAGLEAGDSYIVYDRENHRAWLEADLALAVDAMR